MAVRELRNIKSTRVEEGGGSPMTTTTTAPARVIRSTVPSRRVLRTINPFVSVILRHVDSRLRGNDGQGSRIRWRSDGLDITVKTCDTSSVSEYHVEGKGPLWRGVYRIGGVAALITVLVALLDIILSFLPGERDVEPGGLSAIDWFARFQESRFLALRDLGLWNIVNTTLAVPVYLALFGVHRRASQAFAALAAILSLIGAAVYTANNKALPMLALSDRYAAASTDDERARLAATGQAMLAQGEDFTPGSFMGFFLTEIAGIVMGITMLRSRVFGRPSAWAGIAGSGLLLALTVCATFVPAA